METGEGKREERMAVPEGMNENDSCYQMSLSLSLLVQRPQVGPLCEPGLMRQWNIDGMITGVRIAKRCSENMLTARTTSPTWTALGLNPATNRLSYMARPRMKETT
jgi:hypothetical protein